jgi:hypothetical protein
MNIKNKVCHSFRAIRWFVWWCRYKSLTDGRFLIQHLQDIPRRPHSVDGFKMSLERVS